MELIFIPARMGEKKKNLWQLNGRPLIDYVLTTACTYQQQVGNDKVAIVVSTDCEEITSRTWQYMNLGYNIMVVDRPENLAGPDAKVEDAIKYYIAIEEPGLFPVLTLMQPTSPFITVDHVRDSFLALQSYDWNSAQTIISTPHNYHWVNTRIRKSSAEVMFKFPEERTSLYNKQRKEHTYAFGNLVSVRTNALLFQDTLWAWPSRPIEIMRYTALDVDTRGDLAIAEAYIQSRLVQPLPSIIERKAVMI